jgi:hypothetical protein
LHHFFPNYATTTHGFLWLLHSDVPFIWDDQAQQSFDALKQDLASTPLIGPLNFDKEFILYISSSSFVVARVLVQDGPDGCEHIIYYMSKNPLGTPFSYTYVEKLALVIVFSI